MKAVFAAAFLAGTGYLAAINAEKLIAQYQEAFPADPQRREALDLCATDPRFNRLDPADRQGCRSVPFAEAPTSWVGLAPVMTPRYDFNPSHLPRDDIRRQQANEAFTAMAPPVTPPPLPAASAKNDKPVYAGTRSAKRKRQDWAIPAAAVPVQR